VNTSLVERPIADDLVPVIATIGVDVHGQAYNVNADLGAAAVAAAISARKLIYLTDVDVVLTDVEDPDTLVREVEAGGLSALVAEGLVSEGMIPKVEGCIEALAGGVGSAHIINGGTPHALLVELLTDRGVGTMVTSGGPA
jgi:acetylglutamate kinase